MAQLTFRRARTEENKRRRAAALMEAARSLASETGVASVTLTAVANRAGIHYSAVRRYFTSHKEVLLHLAAEGWVRWSKTVCESLSEPGPMSHSRVAAAWPTAWPPIRCSATCWPIFTCTSSTRWTSTGWSR
ncbi:bacterial regulatory s, tetR family protein [Mycobacterium kansasii]|uniref:Bacterial regulatory s, tetR family protein n=1 Tax=Mycobacterium kansasii TaxID=1768 RepID=A0A1V3WPX4_MYCKA|nr:bacterial regulatory s, tetR family protein [Mycobacterium kansasii]